MPQPRTPSSLRLWVAVLGAVGVAAVASAQLISTPPPLVAPPDEETIWELWFPEEPLVAPPATFEEQIAELVNLERLNCADAGCPKPPLKHQGHLIAAAEGHAAAMALDDFFSHRGFSSGCNTVGDRMNAAGYTGWTNGGENIAAGNATAAATMAQWMASSGHRANILSSNYRDLGAGHFHQAGDQPTVDLDCNSNCTCTDPTACGGNPESCSAGPYSHYWVQVFGARGGTTGYPMIIEREKHLIASRNVALHLYQPPGSNPQMRFANETGSFSGSEAFSTAKAWQLSAGDGRKAVITEVTTGSGTFRTCDRIWLDGSGDGSFVFAEGFECDGLAAWSAVVP